MDTGYVSPVDYDIGGFTVVAGDFREVWREFGTELEPGVCNCVLQGKEHPGLKTPGYCRKDPDGTHLC